MQHLLPEEAVELEDQNLKALEEEEVLVVVVVVIARLQTALEGEVVEKGLRLMTAVEEAVLRSMVMAGEVEGLEEQHC